MLEQYRDLVINKEELIKKGGIQLLNETGEAVVVCNQHLIELISQYINGSVSKERVLEWVNTIWFSDVFDYCNDGCDCIASIMIRLEELDEGFALDMNTANMLIEALESNKEI